MLLCCPATTTGSGCCRQQHSLILQYAHAQGWCRRDLVQGVLSPRLYRQENLPAGPAWSDVKRLIAATSGPTVGQLRNRAMLLLLAVYGLRSGEVRGLSLEDMDWPRRVLRVRRSKTARVQEYPLTTAMGQALRRYLEEARPDCARRELFLTLHAPFRQLTGWIIVIYHRRTSTGWTASIMGCERISAERGAPGPSAKGVPGLP